MTTQSEPDITENGRELTYEGQKYQRTGGGPRLDISEIALFNSFNSELSSLHGDVPNIKLGLQGRAIIDDNGLMIIGDKNSKITEIMVNIHGGEIDEILKMLADIDEKHPGESNYEKFHGNGRIALTCSGDDWYADIYVRPDIMEHFVRAVRENRVSSLSVQPNLRNIYLDYLTYMAAMPELGQMWYLAPSKHGRAKAALGDLNSFTLHEKPISLKVGGDFSKEHETQKADIKEPQQPISSVSTQLSQIKSMLKWMVVILAILALGILLKP